MGSPEADTTQRTIGIVHPYLQGGGSGNRTTADRWSGIFEELGWNVFRCETWDGSACDALVALHARHSHGSILRFHRELPEVPIVVAGTGTDLYSEIDDGGAVRESLGLAQRIVVLQNLAVQALPPELRERARVIHQSARAPHPLPAKSSDTFDVAFVANVRPVKDPLCAVRAALRLPADGKIRIRHLGATIDEGLAAEMTTLAGDAPCFSSAGPVSRAEALDLIARSHLLLSTSRQEGGSNVISEALATDVPVLATRIPGSLGLLGEDYAGVFEVSDDEAVATLIQRACDEPEFYAELQSACRDRSWLADPATELESWRRLLRELFEEPAS